MKIHRYDRSRRSRNNRDVQFWREARERHQEGRWQEALAAAKRADALLAADGGDGEIQQRVREVLGDMQMVANLELARTRATHYGFDDEQEDRNYARVFREYGIDAAAGRRSGIERDLLPAVVARDAQVA